jgi:predicted metal-dependent phosphoesterase TrpH
MIDLHTHSTASDGSLSPALLIDEAVKSGLSAIALTDHDTIDGLPEAEAASMERRIRFIPGIEIAVTWEPGECHLLGLGLKNLTAHFLETIAGLSRAREKRNREILKRMNELGFAAEYEDIAALAGGTSIGRPHFAAFLVKQKVVRTSEQAFERFLAKGRPLYVAKEGLGFSEAAALIKESGALTILAHPLSLYVAWGRLPIVIESLRDQGLDGIEAWHPTAKVTACRRLEELGKKLGLFITAGSDFHGAARPNQKLGLTAGKRRIEDSFLEALTPLH